MKYYLLAATALSLTSCLSTQPDTCSATVVTPITTATGPKTVAVNAPAVYTLVYTPAGGCGTSSSVTPLTNGNTQVVNVNVTYTNCNCAALPTLAQTTYTFQPTQAGTYYLKFVATGGYLTDTLVVK